MRGITHHLSPLTSRKVVIIMCLVFYINEQKFDIPYSLDIEDAIFLYSPEALYQILSGEMACYLEDGQMLILSQKVIEGMNITLSDRISPIPFICTNILDKKTGESIRERFGLCTVASIPVGVLGISTKKVIAHYEPAIIQDLIILPIDETVKKFALAMRQSGVDIIVLLSRAGFSFDKIIAPEIKEVDIIINSNSMDKATYPIRKDEIWIIPQGSSIEEVEEVFGMYFPVEVRFFFSELLRLMRSFC